MIIDHERTAKKRKYNSVIKVTHCLKAPNGNENIGDFLYNDDIKKKNT